MLVYPHDYSCYNFYPVSTTSTYLFSNYECVLKNIAEVMKVSAARFKRSRSNTIFMKYFSSSNISNNYLPNYSFEEIEIRL